MRVFALLLALAVLATDLIFRMGGMAALYDYLTISERLPAPAQREWFLLRLSTHQVPLLSDEIDILGRVRDAGYRRLMIYYSMPTAEREKFVECSPLSQGMAPTEFFRLKLEPMGIGAERYRLVRIDAPYASDEPFATLARAVAEERAASITFASLPLEQRGFALMARRYFGIPAYAFDARSHHSSRESWWRSHSGLESVAAAYLNLLGAAWP
ncbi:hypothetical protein [Methyloterricola oryzae]|uniref:hypothetical protein n=1 Tax=Methyloterricola oryzae TaxID=1495050 RepID=UPI0005EB0D44|nr:hypothetical protein [Methyloterricola oryzae]